MMVGLMSAAAAAVSASRSGNSSPKASLPPAEEGGDDLQMKGSTSARPQVKEEEEAGPAPGISTSSSSSSSSSNLKDSATATSPSRPEVQGKRQISTSSSLAHEDLDGKSNNKKSFYVVRPKESFGDGEGEGLQEPIIFFSYHDLQFFMKVMNTKNKNVDGGTPTLKKEEGEQGASEDDRRSLVYQEFDNLNDAMDYVHGTSLVVDDSSNSRSKITSTSTPNKRQKMTEETSNAKENTKMDVEKAKQPEASEEEEENILMVAARIRQKEEEEESSPPNKEVAAGERKSSATETGANRFQHLQDEYDTNFQRKLEELRFFKEEYGHINIPSISTSLRDWLNQQRQLYAELVHEQDNAATKAPYSPPSFNPLKLEHIVALTSLGFSIMPTLPPSQQSTSISAAAAAAAAAHLHHPHVPAQHRHSLPSAASSARAAAVVAAANTLLAGGHGSGYPVSTSAIHHGMMGAPHHLSSTAAAAIAAAATIGGEIREANRTPSPRAPAAAAAPMPAVMMNTNSTTNSSQWTEQEDAIIREAVLTSQEQPFTRWSDLARTKLPTRKGKQIRDRWVNQLNPAITKTPFTSEDDMQLWNAHEQCGKRWVEISSKFFHGRRSENQVKNRWYSAAFQKFIKQNNINSKRDSPDSAPAPTSGGGGKKRMKTVEI